MRIESNYAREFRFAICFAASNGWLSVIEPDGRAYTRSWHITVEGLHALRKRPSGPPDKGKGRR